MTSLKKLIAVAAASLPLIGSAQTPPADAAAAKPPPPLYQIYGTLNVNLQNTMAKGAFDRTQSVSSRLAVSPDSTNIGVKGAADIGFGLQAVYQCETTADVTGQGVAGLCNRNSRIGISSPVYGTVFYGNWDTPYKALTYGTKADDPFGNTDVFGYNDLLSSPGFRTQTGTWTGNLTPTSITGATPAALAWGAAGTGVTSFDLRAQNSVAYWSPKIMGASLRVQYSANEFRTGSRARIGNDISSSYGYQINPYLVSVGLNYDFGPLALAAGFERHYDGAGLVAINGGGATGANSSVFQEVTGQRAATVVGDTISPNVNTLNPVAWAADANASGAHGSPTTQDDAWKLGAGYELATPFGPFTVAAAVEQLKYTQDTPAQDSLKEYKRMAYMLAAKQRMGAHEFRARYTLADDGSAKLGGVDPVNRQLVPGDPTSATDFKVSTKGYGASSVALGYSYHFTKAAQVYLYYVRIDNQYRAQYTFTTGGAAPVVAVNAGADPVAYGLGMRYGF